VNLVALTMRRVAIRPSPRRDARRGTGDGAIRIPVPRHAPDSSLVRAGPDVRGEGAASASATAATRSRGTTGEPPIAAPTPRAEPDR
jgi:hypothetical protein